MQQLGKEASASLARNADQLTDDIIHCQTKLQPDLQERYGEQGFAPNARSALDLAKELFKN